MRRRAPTHNFLENPASVATERKSGSSKIHKSSKDWLLQSLIKIALLCKENRADELFTQFLLSLPATNCRSINNVPEIRGSKRRNEVLKITNNRTKHRNTSAREKNTHKIKKNNKTHSTFKCQGISSRVKKGKFKNKHTSTPKKQKCIFCMKERVHINHHYLVTHKIFFPDWVKRISETENSYNATCVQCNRDFNDAPGLNKHMIKYHNINGEIDLKKLIGDERKNNYMDDVFDKKKTVSDAGSTGSSHEFVNTQKENVTIQRDVNAQEHMLMSNQVTGNEGQRVDNLSKIYRFCKQCQKYVSVPLFQSHTAAHQKDRERYQRQLEHPELSQNFQAPYEQLDNCAEPADRQAFVDIPSDGNCFFYSIIKLLDLSTTPSEIRSELLASPFVDSCLNPDGARKILSSETDYAETDCIYIFSKVYDKNVCIHYRYVNTATQIEEVQYCHFRVNASQSFLHLHLQDLHYTPLIEMSSDHFQCSHCEKVYVTQGDLNCHLDDYCTLK